MYDSAARSQQSRPAAPTSPAGNATAPLAQSLNSSPRVVAQRALAAQLNVAQRAVPRNNGLPKPVAETGNYAANNDAENVAFWTADYPRSRFDFGVGTRNAVLARYHPTYRQGSIESVRVVTGSQENVRGVQIDHRYSWANIAFNMNSRNTQALAAMDAGDAVDDADWYSLWDARMYYNDLPNLQPVLASDNAAAGAFGVVAAPAIHDALATAVADTHSRWMALQRDVNRLGNNPDQQFRQNVVGRLQNTRTDMAATATAIENHLNPPVVNPNPVVVNPGNAMILE
jgi:hypothetical protein